MNITCKHKKYKRLHILHALHETVSFIPLDPLVTRKIKYIDDEGRTPLMLASMHGVLEEVRCVFHEADMNVVDDDGWTALMYAAHHGHANVVSFLVEKGVDRHLTTHSGLKASQLAYFNSHYEIYQTLQEH